MNFDFDCQLAQTFGDKQFCRVVWIGADFEWRISPALHSVPAHSHICPALRSVPAHSHICPAIRPAPAHSHICPAPRSAPAQPNVSSLTHCSAAAHSMFDYLRSVVRFPHVLLLSALILYQNVAAVQPQERVSRRWE